MIEHNTFIHKIHKNVVLAPFTTFKIGGKADYFVEVTTEDELVLAITQARKAQLPYFLLGLGANILIGDSGFRGLVIRNLAQKAFLDPETGLLTAESGAWVFPNLIEIAVSAGYGGLEHYAGIPSTVGGALWQNLHFLSPPPARSRTMFIEEVLHTARILTPTNETFTVDRDWFGFGYDQSRLHHSGDIVLSATFQLAKTNETQLRETIAANLQWRQERHPPLDEEPSAGSIFQKIDGIGAGRLIDQAGLKGYQIGKAEISSKHANFIVNRGGATAADVRTLITHVQQVVQQHSGHLLQPEIGFVGEF
ncbi:MAG TPA: UDP-N-acetylmuramate dehydrogenase [Rhodothermales bacterium]|nr:UDP-N-acetylmuramate dehydrogenase [Rhodothermales bacterium]